MNRSSAPHGSHWLRPLGGALFGLGLALVASFGAARAEDSLPETEVSEIHDVISAQLDAFKRDDAQAAFQLASPDIQEQFGSPENFLNLVREQYPPVYRSKAAEFQPIVEMKTGDGIVQPVLVTGPDNIPVLAVYMVEQQTDGTWRISGCLLYALAPKGIET